MSARSRGALLEMCWHFVPVATILAASVSSHRRPDALAGSNSRPRPVGPAATYIVSSVTSPNSPENRSMWVTPGYVSFVNCGMSSMVSSPYFFFISSLCGLAGALALRLKICRSGQVFDARRASFSFSFKRRGAGRCAIAGSAAVPTSVAAPSPNPADLMNPRRLSP